MIPIMTMPLTQKMPLIMNITDISLKVVTSIMTELLMLVKSTLVSLWLKMNGELKIVQLNMVPLTANVHSMSLNVKVLGTVSILS